MNVQLKPESRRCVHQGSVALTEIFAVRVRREGNKFDIDLLESSDSNQLSAFNELVRSFKELSYIMQDLMNCITPWSLLLSLPTSDIHLYCVRVWLLLLWYSASGYILVYDDDVNWYKTEEA